MKKDKQENNEQMKSVEQETLGPPSNIFYVTDEMAERFATTSGIEFTTSPLKECL